MFATALFIQALAASAAFALPSGRERLNKRVASRQGLPRHSEQNLASNASHVDYSTNWAGAVLSADAGTYKSVTATFTVPTPKEPSGGSGSHSASAWVGIDGDTCGTAILQTGLDFTIDGSSVSYDSWYEWYPDYAYDFSGITFSAGDSVTLTVTATSTKAGKAVITNNTKGKTVTKSITSTTALCEQDAEWIVEDFEEDSSLVPFANFGKVVFSGASAGTSSGSVGPSGATILDIKQSGTVLTSVSTTSSSVTVSYV